MWRLIRAAPCAIVGLFIMNERHMAPGVLQRQIKAMRIKNRNPFSVGEGFVIRSSISFVERRNDHVK